jgi:ribosomal protein S18 acetylase RimI-like enzyme
VQIASLGYRTDLALLELGGSVFEERPDCVVVRTPHNPTFWWGNFVLFPRPPSHDETDRCLEVFQREFPDAQHVALGFDGIDGSVDDLADFSRAGLTPEASSVMTAGRVHEPARPNRDAEYRTLESDDDWAQQVELHVACRDDDQEEASHRVFSTAKATTARTLVAKGHGAWFGAFVDGQLRSSMGLFRASPGLARFQSVETFPNARGHGLAGTLVHYVSQYGFDRLGAHTLVMVADPTYLAIRIYRSVGFATTENQLQVERRGTA